MWTTFNFFFIDSTNDLIKEGENLERDLLSDRYKPMKTSAEIVRGFRGFTWSHAWSFVLEFYSTSFCLNKINFLYIMPYIANTWLRLLTDTSQKQSWKPQKMVALHFSSERTWPDIGGIWDFWRTPLMTWSRWHLKRVGNSD